jgi:hypothetical protein
MASVLCCLQSDAFDLQTEHSELLTVSIGTCRLKEDPIACGDGGMSYVDTPRPNTTCGLKGKMIASESCVQKAVPQ